MSDVQMIRWPDDIGVNDRDLLYSPSGGHSKHRR